MEGQKNRLEESKGGGFIWNPETQRGSIGKCCAFKCLSPAQLHDDKQTNKPRVSFSQLSDYSKPTVPASDWQGN